jgi:hypothetical protein
LEEIKKSNAAQGHFQVDFHEKLINLKDARNIWAGKGWTDLMGMGMAPIKMDGKWVDRPKVVLINKIILAKTSQLEGICRC